MIPISLEEALARLTDDGLVTAHLERMPNNGITEVQEIPRPWVIDRLHNNSIFETGIEGQNIDLGIHIHVSLKDPKTGSKIGIGRLFFQTKKECRLTDVQLAESIARGQAANIFSEPKKDVV